MSVNPHPNSVHERTIDTLIERLERSGRYDNIIRDYTYKTSKYSGQIDVLAFNAKANVWHMYEIKSTYRNKNYTKARAQFSRFVKTHSDIAVKGVYVTPKAKTKPITTLRARRLYVNPKLYK